MRSQKIRMKQVHRTLVWFRGKDLRVSDHEPLIRAMEDGEVIPLFVFDPYFFHPLRARKLPHRIQFLLESISALSDSLSSLGSRLICVSGSSTAVIPDLAERWGVTQVFAHRWTEPFGRVRDAKVADALSVPFKLYEGETLHPPGTLRTGKGSPYSVFTPFSRALRSQARISAVLPPPQSIPPVPKVALTDNENIPELKALGIDRNPSLQNGGEAAGQHRLKLFLEKHAAGYSSGRDQLGASATSRLSADIKFGTLSVRTIWEEMEQVKTDACAESIETFKTELIWRDFAYSTLWDRPEVLKHPFRSAWEGFPWQNDPEDWKAWTAGRTGYPVIDAAARELRETGFVHNRARMITASFLCKHLLIDYRRGESHFLKYLTDGDWAQNNAGWQWSAGSGCDAQPYFRVFNPFSQGEKFDPSGAYVRRWIPELKLLPNRYIYRPWDAPEEVLAKAKVSLGADYPAPIVDHAMARERFLRVAKGHLKRGE